MWVFFRGLVVFLKICGNLVFLFGLVWFIVINVFIYYEYNFLNINKIIERWIIWLYRRVRDKN